MKVIQQEGNAKLVEWVDAQQVLRRAVLPADSDEVESGIPYGYAFAALLGQHGIPLPAADCMEQQLHQYGIWTAEDAVTRSGVVVRLGKHCNVNSAIILQTVIKEVQL